MKEILSKIKNHQGIQGILDEHKDKWQNFPAFVEAKKRLDDLLEKSDLFRGVIGNKSYGITQTKQALKAEMLKEVGFVADALKAFAEAKENKNLLILIDAQSKRLIYARKDIEVYDACTAYMELSAPYQTDILDYKVTAIMFENAKELVKNYKKHVSLPNTVIKSNKSTKQSLFANTAEISKLLKNRIDKLVNLLARDCPEMAEKYYVLRPLNKVAHRKRKDKNDDQPLTA
jgi:lipid A disaccharide synthetase